MQVTETNTDGLKREFKVVVPAGQIAAKVTARLTEIGRTASLPGFRPGKIPMPMLQKRYGSAVMGEVLEEAVNEGAGKALRDNNLRPALQPKIDITDYKQGGDLEFSMAVEVMPEVDGIDFGAIALERPVAEVPEDEVGKALERLAERRKTSEPLEESRPAAEGDVAVINFVGKLNGEAFQGGSAEDFELTLGSGTFIPGFEEQVAGMSAGETRTITVTFPENYGAKHLAGQEVQFDVTLNALRKPVPAAIDDELAKGVGFESLDALKSHIRQDYENDFKAMSRAHLKRALLDALAERAQFPVPQGLVDLEFEGIWKQVEADKEAGKLDAEDQSKSEDELKAEYRGIATRRVRLGLLLSEVGQKNNISLTQEDVNRALMNEARRFPGQEHLVFQYYQQNEDALNTLKAPVYEDKVVDFILELAQVTDKPVTVDELMRAPGEAAA